MTPRASRPWYELAFDRAYPVVYAHRDADEARRCLDLAERLLPDAPGPWLDLGCGEGRHLRDLAARGRPVFGIDLSATLLKIARAEAPESTLVRADMRRLPLARGSCGAVLSLFTAFGYFGAIEAHAPLVAEIVRVLHPGGGWLLDYLDCERVTKELAPGSRTRERRAGPLHVRETRRLADRPRRVIKRVELRPVEGEEVAAMALGVGSQTVYYDEEVTLFSLAEIDELAAGAGLERTAAAGNYDGGPLQPGNSDRWLLLYGTREGRR